jgi:hypothetical protein
MEGICTSEEEIQDQETQSSEIAMSVMLEEKQKSMVRFHLPPCTVDEWKVSLKS